MNKPKVSIIVPVYKAEKTIRRCVDSLLNQSFTSFEVLLIDDGSPDNCGVICEDYARKDYRIRAIHQDNQGVSAARQCGIDHANGEYTIHADPDDWVEETMLEELYQKAKDEDADMVICDYYENTYKGQKYIKQQPSSMNPHDVLHDLFKHLHGSTWNKLIRRNCYQEYDVHFPKCISFCEDQYVIAALLKNNIQVSYLPKAFYHYVRPLDKESLSRKYTVNTYKMDLRIRDMFNSLLKETDIGQDVYEGKTYSMVSRAFWGGRPFFSSKQFAQFFLQYKSIVKKRSHTFSERLLLYLSINGMYQVSIRIATTILACKHIVLKK